MRNLKIDLCLNLPRRDEYVRPLPEDFFTAKHNNGLQVNISAVVGMNGDGKSTLIELAMRLINNCAKHYRQ